MSSPMVATRGGRRADGEGAPGKAGVSLLGWGVRFVGLFVVFLVSFSVGGMLVGSALPPDAESEPGLVSPGLGILLIALANLFIVSALILTSRWRGWRLALTLGLIHYGVVTFLMQIETWYFLSTSTVTPEILARLFVMGIPTAFVAVPLAVWVLGRGGSAERFTRAEPVLSVRGTLAWKVAALVVAYVVLYFVAGYYIAWQNPELRAFYGQPGDPLPFFSHMRQESILLSLVPFQMLRALVWIACALPIVWWSRVGRAGTAILVGLLFSVPQNVVHLLANPLMPNATIRHAHLVETATSTFVFGVLVVLLLYGEIRGTRTRAT